MKKLLNNKGYMLVEIILASVIAMGVGFFITELTIKLKNKNDDLLVKTLVHTDQSIIYNTIMNDLYELDSFDCDDIMPKLSGTTNKIFQYGSFKNIMSEYAKIDAANITCTNDYANKSVYLTIPIKVPQLQNEDFNVVIRKLASP